MPAAPERKAGCGVEISRPRPRRPRPSPSHGDEGTGDGVTEKRKTERQRGREAERQRDEEVEATERDACSNRNVKVRGEEARPGTRGVKLGYEIRNVGNVKNYQCEELSI